MARGKLTPKQEAFVREYLIDLNAAAAARRAGYSPKTADRTGYENLRKPEIAAAIEAAQAERAQKVELTAEYVLNSLRGIAEDEDQPAAPRVRALELLGKHQGMFVERVDHTSKGEQVGAVAINVYLPDNGRESEAGES